MREAAAHLVGRHDFRNFCQVGLLRVLRGSQSSLSGAVSHGEGLAAGDGGEGEGEEGGEGEERVEQWRFDKKIS